MIMKKETLVFLASLAIIFIIGYVNMSLAPKDVFNPDENEIVQDGSATENENEIFGDITDITDLTDLANNENEENSGVPVIQTNEMNISFANFKLTKEKSNLDIVDQLEESLSNSLISEATKEKFESFLLNKNNYIEKEKDIELMLQSKGYNESIVVVDAEFIKVITNDTIEQADAVKILDVIVSETNYEPSQIKIVKFDNIDL